MMDYVKNDNGFRFADNLRSLRKRMKWSQEELADKVGLNRGNIASYENGTAEPKICNLVKIAHLFNLPVYTLTHSNLKEDAVMEQELAQPKNGFAQPGPDLLGHFLREADYFQQAIKGLHCLFRLKTKNAAELPEEAVFLKEQFEQLYGLTEQLMSSHVELLGIVREKCPTHGQAAE
ncbi:MAG: helix-turn-helix domain-containing protein [Saprospiraceae bacterium]|jgi:transcriptional regulator with XRE-family HTH domain|nr:helix-turn-helix domain-containing protein [Saprospiraceae bacterium]